MHLTPCATTGVPHQAGVLRNRGISYFRCATKRVVQLQKNGTYLTRQICNLSSFAALHNFSWVAANNARIAPPPPLSRRVTGNCFYGVGCGVSYGSLTHDDLADGEVADAEGLLRIVSVGVEHDALCSSWRQLVLGFWSPWLSLSIALPLAAFVAPSYQRDGGP